MAEERVDDGLAIPGIRQEQNVDTGAVQTYRGVNKHIAQVKYTVWVLDLLRHTSDLESKPAVFSEIITPMSAGGERMLTKKELT